MPNLQEHQLRVAAVARQICDNLTVPVDSSSVITACLLHDMGNIIKFDLSQFPEFYEPEGVDYWRKVQQEFINEYGPDEHQASLDIAKELGASQKVLDCIDSVDFGQALNNISRSDIEPKICDHADLRVGPHGIVSIEQRLEDGRRRYKDRPERWISPEKWQELSQACHDLESQIFENCKIKPTDITDESTAPVIEELRAYKI